jgi:hypothetical protein
MSDELNTEVFLVMTNRRDASFPGIAKTCGNGGAEMFLTEEAAQDFCRKISGELGNHFGVYRSLIQIVERLS